LRNINSFQFHSNSWDFKGGMEGAKPHSGHPDMKLRIEKQRLRAMTALEVLVVVVCVLVLIAMLLPILASSRRRASRINCVSNLKQVNLSLRIWAGDNNNQYPMSVSITNGGGMEAINAGNPDRCFQVISNEICTTMIFVCPCDPDRTFATNFDELNGSHISYFLSVDARETYPQMILDGDDNFAVNGKPVNSGILDLSSNPGIAWSGNRHRYVGNIGLADGSVEQQSLTGLQNTIQYSTNGTPFPTCRIAIP